jgi:hypothetical protein
MPPAFVKHYPQRRRRWADPYMIRASMDRGVSQIKKEGKERYLLGIPKEHKKDILKSAFY